MIPIKDSNVVFDYTTMTKSDVYGLITALSPRAYTISNDEKWRPSWLVSDQGAGRLAGNWRFRAAVKGISSGFYFNRQCFLGLANAVAGWESLTTGSYVQGLSIDCNGGTWHINLHDGNRVQSRSFSGAWRYVELERAGYTLTAKMFTDPAYSALDATLTLTGVKTTGWRYLYGWDAWADAVPSGNQSIQAGELSLAAIGSPLRSLPYL